MEHKLSQIKILLKSNFFSHLSAKGMRKQPSGCDLTRRIATKLCHSYVFSRVANTWKSAKTTKWLNWKRIFRMTNICLRRMCKSYGFRKLLYLV